MTYAGLWGGLVGVLEGKNWIRSWVFLYMIEIFAAGVIYDKHLMTRRFQHCALYLPLIYCSIVLFLYGYQITKHSIEYVFILCKMLIAESTVTFKFVCIKKAKRSFYQINVLPLCYLFYLS